MKRSRFWTFFDWVIFPAILAAIAYEPNFMHGAINPHEEGQYAAVVEGFFRGQAPYKDIYLLFGPLTYAGPALAMAVFGKHLAVQRGWFLLGDIAGFLAFYALARATLRGRFFACLAAILAIVEVHDPYWCTRWGGFRFPALYLFLAFWVRHLRNGRRRDAAWAGFFCALGFLHSIDIGLLGAFTFAMSWVVRRAWFETKAVRGSARAFASGALAVLAPFFLWLVSRGALGAFVREMGALGSRRAWLQTLPAPAMDPLKMWLQPVVYGLVFARSFARPARRAAVAAREELPLFAVAVCALFSYAFSFHGLLGPQFERSLPLFILVLAALAEPGLLPYLNAGRRAFRMPVDAKTIAIPVLCSAALATIFLSAKRPYDGALDDWCRHQLRKTKGIADVGGHYGGSPRKVSGMPRAEGITMRAEQVSEVERVYRLVTERTGPDDPVFAFPDLTIYTFLCARPEVSRFATTIYAWPREAWRRDLLEALESRRPKVALLRNDESGLLASVRAPHALSEAADFVKKHYRLIESVGSVDVYEIRPDSF